MHKLRINLFRGTFFLLISYFSLPLSSLMNKEEHPCPDKRKKRGETFSSPSTATSILLHPSSSTDSHRQAHQKTTKKVAAHTRCFYPDLRYFPVFCRPFITLTPYGFSLTTLDVIPVYICIRGPPIPSTKNRIESFLF